MTYLSWGVWTLLSKLRNDIFVHSYASSRSLPREGHFVMDCTAGGQTDLVICDGQMPQRTVAASTDNE